MKSLTKILILGTAGGLAWHFLPRYRLGLVLVALAAAGYAISEGKVL